MGERLYKLPEMLKGKCEEDTCRGWLECQKRRHSKRYSWISSLLTVSVKWAIHQAVKARDGNDPYTGSPLRWDLIKSYNNDEAKKKGRAYKRRFADMPTLDHIFDDNDNLTGFEIVSWQLNDCKNDLCPEEFVKLCRAVAIYRNKKKSS